MSGAAKASVFLGGLFALGALAWMILLPTAVERGLRAQTGFDVHITVLTANPFTGHVVVMGMKAQNPPRYRSPDFLEVRDLHADVGLGSSLFTGRLVVNDLYLDVATIQIVRQHNGTTNAGEFMAPFSRGGGAGSASPPASPRRYLVRTLRLRIERLVVVDYTGKTPDTRAYTLNIDHTYSNFTGPQQLLVPEVVRSLYAFGIRHDTAQLLPGDFGRALSDAVGVAENLGTKLKGARQKAGDYLKGMIDKLEQSRKP